MLIEQVEKSSINLHFSSSTFFILHGLLIKYIYSSQNIILTCAISLAIWTTYHRMGRRLEFDNFAKLHHLDIQSGSYSYDGRF